MGDNVNHSVVKVTEREAHKAGSNRKTRDEVVYSLGLTLSCEEDGSKTERELQLTWIPKTVAELQTEIEKRFNIPTFDQKLKFGPSALKSEDSIHSHSLRSGDCIVVEYTSDVDVEVIVGVVSCIKNTLSFIESVHQEVVLFPISQALERKLQQNINLSDLDNLFTLYVPLTPTQKFMTVQVFIASGGLTYLQRLHSLLLTLPFRRMTIHLQLLEIGINKLLWVISSPTEAEALVKKDLNWQNIVQSFLRVTAIANAVIVLPKNPYTEQFGNLQAQIVVELLTVTMDCLSCVLEYDAPEIQHSLASNQRFVEQVLGALQSRSLKFRSYLSVMCVMVDLTYNTDVHDSLCKPHVIQAVIKLWRNIEPTPENNATHAECVYMRYLTAILLSLLCSTRQSFSLQYLQIAEFLKGFIDKVDYKKLHEIEDQQGIHWNKYYPYMRVCFSPYFTEKYMHACGSDHRFRELQLMCIETCVLSLQVSLLGDTERKRMVQQGFMEYVICLPGVLPNKSRAQQRAKDLVAMLGKKMHLQPPSLNILARATLAASGFELEEVMKSTIQQLLSNSCQPFWSVVFNTSQLDDNINTSYLCSAISV